MEINYRYGEWSFDYSPFEAGWYCIAASGCLWFDFTTRPVAPPLVTCNDIPEMAQLW